MRKLAEVNAVLEYIVNVPEEITNGFAVRALHFISLLSFTESFLLFFQKVPCKLFPLGGGHLSHLDLHFRVVQLLLAVRIVNSLVQEEELAELTEKLTAMFAFFWFIGEVVAHDASDFFNHLALQLVLNGVEFNI